MRVGQQARFIQGVQIVSESLFGSPDHFSIEKKSEIRIPVGGGAARRSRLTGDALRYQSLFPVRN
jgi:hypothetical protein